MKLGKLYLPLVMLVLLSGCATVTETELSNAKFEVLQDNYRQVIQSYMGARLKDPYSATYRFNKPQCGFSQDGFVHGGQKHFGHIVPAFINAKNSYGGFTGEQAYYFFFADGLISNVTGVMGQMANFVPCPNNFYVAPKVISKSDVKEVELESLEKSLKIVEEVSGKDSDAYKIVKEQYESRKAEFQLINK